MMGQSSRMADRPRASRSPPVLLRALWSVVWPSAAAPVLVTIATTVALGLIGPITAWALKLLLDAVAADAVSDDVQTALLILGATACLGAVLPQVQTFASDETGRRMAAEVQDRMLRHLDTFGGLAHFEVPTFHDRILLAQQGGQWGPPVLLASATGVVQGSAALGGFLLAVGHIDWLLAVVAVASALPSLAAEMRYARRRVRVMTALTGNERRRAFYTSIQVDPRAAKEIRLLDAGPFLHGRARSELGAIHDEERVMARAITTGRGALGLLSSFGGILAVVLAVVGPRAGQLSVGDVSVVVASVVGIQTSILGIATASSNAAEAVLRFSFFVDLLHTEPLVRSPSAPVVLRRLEHEIRFDDVSFRYTEDGPWALRGLTLAIPAGATMAVVGPNGAGKSTLVKLLTRSYDPIAGAVRWDGTDVRDVDLGALRSRIAVLFQDFGAFDLTLAENVAFSEGTRTEPLRGLVLAACRAAGLDETIDALPGGVDTLLSRVLPSPDAADGTELSGGQWQRVALARAYLKDSAEVMVFDEPTASLDVEAEHALFRRIRGTMRERTNIIVTHRLRSTMAADLVAVVEAGRVVEVGSPAYLLASGGRYAYYTQLQERLGVLQ